MELVAEQRRAKGEVKLGGKKQALIKAGDKFLTTLKSACTSLFLRLSFTIYF